MRHHRARPNDDRSRPSPTLAVAAAVVRPAVATVVALLLASAALAQTPDAAATERSPAAVTEVARRVVLDPTTYGLATVFYTANRLDWNSSQPLFRHGYYETHPGYTVSGFSHDVPVSYAEGNRRILRQSLTLFGQSVANNALSASLERALINRAPRHRKLIRTLGWIERTAFASYWSYRLSVQHFEQWRRNQRLASEIGAK